MQKVRILIPWWFHSLHYQLNLWSRKLEPRVLLNIWSCRRLPAYLIFHPSWHENIGTHFVTLPTSKRRGKDKLCEKEQSCIFSSLWVQVMLLENVIVWFLDLGKIAIATSFNKGVFCLFCVFFFVGGIFSWNPQSRKK